MFHQAASLPEPRAACLVETGYGTIYTSDDRGIVYSKSLERHLYTTTGGETDFINVTSLRGIYITSVLSEGECMRLLSGAGQAAAEHCKPGKNLGWKQSCPRELA